MGAKAIFCRGASSLIKRVASQTSTLDSGLGCRAYSVHVRRNTRALTTGELAAQAAVSQETIRFYEREGLISAPPRTDSGYRQYPVETVARVRFILRAKDLGFALKEVRELLSLRLDADTCRTDVRRQASDKIRDLEERIRDLQGMRSRLRALERACLDRGTTEECPILKALHTEDKPE